MKIKKLQTKNNGFTLIEIMIVVSIIGLLAGLGTFAYQKAITKSRIKTVEAEISMISAAVQQLTWDTGRWPNGTSLKDSLNGTSERWNLSEARVGLFKNDGTFKNWKGPYYEGSISDPWGNNYFFDPDYRRDGTHAVIGSFGPNGVGRNKYDDDDVWDSLKSY